MATTAAAQSSRLTTNLTLALARPVIKVAILLCTDGVALTLAVTCGFGYWSLVNPTIPREHTAMYLAVAFSMASFAYHGLYPGIGLNAVQYLRSISRGISYVYLLMAASMVLTKDWWANSRGGFFLSWLLALLLAPTGRWLADHFFHDRSWWSVPVVILGAGDTARAVIRNLHQNRILGYRPVLCLDDDPRRQGFCEDVPVMGSLFEAESMAVARQLRCAIVAMPGMSRDRLATHMRRWVQIFPRILIIPNLFGVGSLWVEPRDLGGVLSLELQNKLNNPLNRMIKRASDLVVGAIAAMFAVPVIAAAAIWIKAISPGRAFYRQEREGRGGRSIHVFKLRTMFPNAEAMLERHLAENPQARAEWDQFCKLRKDPRILPGIGRFLRRTSLDELPQLINILRGEMSLVGPRPFPAYHNDRFDENFRALRVQMTPGLTGLWQIKARSDGNLEVQASLDSYYVRNWSLWLDLYILVRTVEVVISARGAY